MKSPYVVKCWKCGRGIPPNPLSLSGVDRNLPGPTHSTYTGGHRISGGSIGKPGSPTTKYGTCINCGVRLAWNEHRK